MALKFKEYLKLLKDAGSEFSDDNATKLSASLAYYTIFSIGPLLLVVITLVSVFYKKQNVTTEIYNQLRTLVGPQGAEQLIGILQNISKQNTTTLFGVIGAIVLVFGATGVFTEIQSSINYIWSIKAKPKKGWLKFIINRLISFSMIVGMGFLLIVSLLVNVLLDLLTDRLQHTFGNMDALLVKGLSIFFLFIITSILFAVIYKVLPDARIRWKDAMVGATFTGILFLAGKFLIGYYLGNSSVGNMFGAAASVIILLSWVYYSSIILYFGAEFTKVYALKHGGGIDVYDTAVFIAKREVKEMPGAKILPDSNSTGITK